VRDNYDFSDAIKNPFAGRFNGKYTTIVHGKTGTTITHYDFTENGEQQEQVADHLGEHHQA
jgi:hypothetical protein